MTRKFKKINEYRLEYGGFKKQKFRFLYYFLAIAVFLLLVNNVFVARHFLDRQIDDVNPLIGCSAEENYFNKSDILMVVPYFNGRAISDYPAWCSKIKSLNKTLGMHGVYHNFNEFLEPRNESYVLEGMNVFKNCFGEYPRYFEAPQLALSSENKKVVESLNMSVMGYGFNIFHKVYHCQDKGKYSNKFIDLV